MGRIGYIGYSDVAAAADAMVSEGLQPTILSVRARLGAGGTDTIRKHLSAWRDTKRANEIAQSSQGGRETLGKLADAYTETVDRLFKSIFSKETYELLRNMNIALEQQSAASKGVNVKANEVKQLQAALVASEQVRIAAEQKVATLANQMAQLLEEDERERDNASQSSPSEKGYALSEIVKQTLLSKELKAYLKTEAPTNVQTTVQSWMLTYLNQLANAHYSRHLARMYCHNLEQFIDLKPWNASPPLDWQSAKSSTHIGAGGRVGEADWVTMSLLLPHELFQRMEATIKSINAERVKREERVISRRTFLYTALDWWVVYVFPHKGVRWN